MASPKQNDFTVQVVALDVVRLPVQALPGGSALSCLARDRTDAEMIAPAALVFVF
jgi:hypothetical protein